MATITQAGQPFRVATALGADELLLDEFSGVDAISSPYAFDVGLLSEDEGIDGAALIRTGLALTFALPDGSERKIHGLIRRFTQLGQRDQLTYYRAEVVPWLWFLSLSTDIKIFQNLSVLEIVEKVFKALGYSDFDVRCKKSYPKREYCVQYRETHLNFVSRLLEEEGIFYFFEHSESKHVLVLADENGAFDPCPVASQARVSYDDHPDEDVVTSFRAEHAAFVGKVTLTDYDYLQPSLSLQQMASGEGVEEQYDYPGLYTSPDAGDRYALIRLQEREATSRVFVGEGTFRTLQAGSTFDLKGHYRRDLNQSYLLTEVRHAGHAGAYRAWESREPHYHNSFVCIPASVPYRPPRLAAKPLVLGSQTAVVVGKSGEEIWVDKLGRVKVQFYWDRDGIRNEKSSCWIRVASLWAGKGWGWVHIPRIGQEVIVDFLEGDPDRPIITGRVYNAEQVPPYELPANQSQSGVKTRSTKGGGTENFNEIRFEDSKGNELFYLHAEKDRQLEVENDNSQSIGRDESLSIERDQTVSVGRNRSESVGGDETIGIEKNRSESVGKDETVSVGGNRQVSIDKNDSLDIGKNREQSIGANETLSVKEKRTTTIGKDDELNVSKKLLISAGDEILIKTGSASITMKKDGTITIKGKDIKLEGSGSISVKASSDITLKGSTIKQN